MPLMSIAMAARNSAPFLAAALESIPSSLGDWEVEIVLADGASGDETLEIASRDVRVRVISRSDGGLYDGMNRALGAARGDLLLILNSDDLLIETPFRQALQAMTADSSLGHISGGASFGTLPEDGFVRRHDCALTAAGALFGIPVINARLFRTDLVRRIGFIRTDLGLGADREWLLRLSKVGVPSSVLPEPFYFYRIHPGSKTLAGGRAGRGRVYRAERQLAAGCLASTGLSVDNRRLVRSAYALATLKQRLTLTGDLAPRVALPNRETVALSDVATGIRQAFQWRKRLSGF